MKKTFTVIEELEINNELKKEFRSVTYTLHLTDFRKDRIFKYLSQMKKIKFVEGFCSIVDKGHVNGFETHLLTDEGFLFIYNTDSKKLITILAPRIAQVKRLSKTNKEIPLNVYENILMNLENNLNNI